MARKLFVLPAALLVACAPVRAELSDELLYQAPFVVREPRRIDPSPVLEDLEAETVTVWRRRPTRATLREPHRPRVGEVVGAIEDEGLVHEPESDDSLYRDPGPGPGGADRPAAREVAFLLGLEPEVDRPGSNNAGAWDPRLPLPPAEPEAAFREDTGAAAEYAAQYAWRPDGAPRPARTKPKDLSRLPPRQVPDRGAAGSGRPGIARAGLGFRGEDPDPLVPPGARGGPEFSTDVFGPGVDVDLEFSVDAFDEARAEPPPGSATIEFESELLAETHVLHRVQRDLVDAGFDSPRIVIKAGSLGRNRFEIDLTAPDLDPSTARRRLAAARRVLAATLAGAADPASVVRILLPTSGAPVVFEESLDARPVRTAGLPRTRPRG